MTIQGRHRIAPVELPIREPAGDDDAGAPQAPGAVHVDEEAVPERAVDVLDRVADELRVGQSTGAQGHTHVPRSLRQEPVVRLQLAVLGQVDEEVDALARETAQPAPRLPLVHPAWILAGPDPEEEQVRARQWRAGEVHVHSGSVPRKLSRVCHSCVPNYPWQFADTAERAGVGRAAGSGAPNARVLPACVLEPCESRFEAHWVGPPCTSAREFN